MSAELMMQRTPTPVILCVGGSTRPVTPPDGSRVAQDDGSPADVTMEAVAALEPVSVPTAPSRPTTAVRSTTAPPRW
jgi:hypothetical protein